MSVHFQGWEVLYDDDQHLSAEQQPKAGHLYTMYHGTTVAQAQSIIQSGFQQSADGMLGAGVYVSRDQKKAKRYPLNAPPADRVVLKLSVDTGKVKRIDTDNHPLQKTWHSQGYDTAWVPPNCGMKAVPSGLEEDCVWDPQRVQVVDIALADSTVLPQLKALVAAQPKSKSRAQNGPANCLLCKRASSVHLTQPCWGCGKNICTFMTKHVCKTV
ncbi:GCRV-induced gene 2p [Amia ocellicauda]|uniref:GCRV-induced gene 2p n=1 Tax=Amia ocellicauda TaxID=2972642 RepID=UPI003464031D